MTSPMARAASPARSASPTPALLPSSAKIRDLEYLDNLEKEGRVPFELKLTLIVSLLMIYPVIACARLTQLPSIRFWFGTWMLTVVVFVPVWILWMHLLLTSGKLSKRRILIAMTLVPSVVLVIACQLQAVQSRSTASQLLSTDCKSFPKKAKLDTAWWAAHNFKKQCMDDLLATTAADKEELVTLLDVETCYGYDEAAEKYRSEWAYLKDVETVQHCGGWCAPGKQLWTHSNFKIHDSCSLVVAQLMDKPIRLFGTQVSSYTGLILIMFCIILVVVPEKWKKPVLGQ